MSDENINEITSIIRNDLHLYELLHDKFVSYLNRDPILKRLVHSHKSRFKDFGHLEEKIKRKNAEDLALDESERKGQITSENVKSRITDICGIRILHIYIGQFEEIHKALMSYVRSGELSLFEEPKAYTWDPEYSRYFEGLGVRSKLKESFYTSVHYVFKPREDSDITCEVQVRTLFEEVWGEIDHDFNYPENSKSRIIQEQLKVLARVVGAGTRLSDSIYGIYRNEEADKKDV
ncbi:MULTISPECIES: RelA/SpoT domain-containing protein [unclassified Halomonas]|uniref:RelA/SpoT domain-containing protein n=1 Tax=unclassified Halomonas TaxID=2609666 RepID=UPI0007D93808|nr:MULTISPECIES: RelA/SpoT domain-containing protein [unclassified Halomonas]MBT2787750.1 RelA/SpoT domain-containing protein [Halomonas sp. ISL-106]MBT2796953.1 RelA/SpoT domain-containing protein [Halomonas sp. ISL-104]OAL61505.1 hypothetical protein A6R74_14400 [Halomonas sp. ALS9]